MQKTNRDFLEGIKVSNHKDEQISFFHAFFSDLEDDKYCDGGVDLLEALAKERRLGNIRKGKGQSRGDKFYDELKKQLIDYPPFRDCLPADPEALVITKGGLILDALDRNSLDMLHQRLINEFYEIDHGLACDLELQELQAGVDALLKAKVKLENDHWTYTISTTVLNLLEKSFGKRNTKHAAGQHQTDKQTHKSNRDKHQRTYAHAGLYNLFKGLLGHGSEGNHAQGRDAANTRDHSARL